MSKGKHHSDLAFCGCRVCRNGMHRGGGYLVQHARRVWRRKIKHLCKQAVADPEIDIPTRATVTYTD